MFTRYRLKRQRAFTLVEVLVALVIVGLALPALIGSISSVVDNTSRMQKQLYAGWIAQNQLVELRLTKELQNQVPKTRQRDTIEYAGQEWDWLIDVTEQETLVGKVYRFDIKVGEKDADDGEWLAVLSGFIGE